MSFFLIAKSQDIGVNKLIYPNTPFSVYELSSYVPVYWEIANLGEDTIENRIVTLTLHAEGSSPRFTEFRADMEVGFTAPIDPRKDDFYRFGLSELFGIQGVMGFITPEHAAGDTIEVCVEATVTGDTDPSNNSMCFEIILEERQDRDMVLHILNPASGSEIHPNHTVDFDLSVRNDGGVTYKKDSVYGQMAIEKDGKTLDLVSVAAPLTKNIQPGDSAIITFSIPLSKDFPLGDVYFGFKVSWLSDDGFYELGESNTNNNIRYVLLKTTTSSLRDLNRSDISAFANSNQLTIKGEFSNESKMNIKLFDLSGKNVLTTNSGYNANGLIQISTTSLDNAIYILAIEQEGRIIYREKVLIK